MSSFFFFGLQITIGYIRGSFLGRGYCAKNCCRCPLGRSLDFFDMDIVVDIGAHQRCSQLCLNEGDLQMYRLAGGDASNQDEKIFLVNNVPEVFNTFDDLSYTLSQMDLTHYRQSAVGQRMMQG